MGPFMPQKTVSITLLTDHAPRNFYLPESQCVSLPLYVFSTQVHCGKPMFNAF